MNAPVPIRAPSIRGLVLTVLAVLALQGAVGFGIYVSFSNWADRDAFAGMFVFGESLFTGLAFAGVIYTILLQRQELSLQREQIILTRVELQRSAQAQQQSARLSAVATLSSIYSEMAEFLDSKPADVKANLLHTAAVVDVAQRREKLIHELETTLGLEESKF